MSRIKEIRINWSIIREGASNNGSESNKTNGSLCQIWKSRNCDLQFKIKLLRWCLIEIGCVIIHSNIMDCILLGMLSKWQASNRLQELILQMIYDYYNILHLKYGYVLWIYIYI